MIVVDSLFFLSKERSFEPLDYLPPPKRKVYFYYLLLCCCFENLGSFYYHDTHSKNAPARGSAFGGLGHFRTYTEMIHVFKPAHISYPTVSRLPLRVYASYSTKKEKYKMKPTLLLLKFSIVSHACIHIAVTQKHPTHTHTDNHSRIARFPLPLVCYLSCFDLLSECEGGFCGFVLLSSIQLK